jgi:hypothetical protein
MERAITLQQMLEGLWRRRLLVLATFAAVLAVGTAVVLGMPKVWRASTVVRVEAHRVAPELVSPSVLSPVEERLRTLAQELFARPRSSAPSPSRLHRDLPEDDGMDAAVEALRAQLDVKVEGEAAFVLGVTGDDPKTSRPSPTSCPGSTPRRPCGCAPTRPGDERHLRRGAAAAVEGRAGPRGGDSRLQARAPGRAAEQAESNMRALDRLMVLMTSRTDARRELQRRQADLTSSRLGPTPSWAGWAQRARPRPGAARRAQRVDGRPPRGAAPGARARRDPGAGGPRWRPGPRRGREPGPGAPPARADHEELAGYQKARRSTASGWTAPRAGRSGCRT